MLALLPLQAAYREKRRQYLTQFDSVPPELYSADLVDYTSFPVSSSSSGDQDGVPSSPGLVVTVFRQDSVSSGDAFVDVPAACASVSDSRLAAGDGEYPAGDGDRGEADDWSIGSLPGGGDDRDDGVRLGIDHRSISAGDLNLKTHYEWLNDEAAVDSQQPRQLVDVPPTPELEEPDLDVSENQTITRESSPTSATDDTESTGPELTTASTSADGTPMDHVEQDPRRCPSSSSSSPPEHQRLSAAERRLVNKQLLLNSTALEAS